MVPAENFEAASLLAPKAQRQNLGCQPQTLEEEEEEEEEEPWAFHPIARRQQVWDLASVTPVVTPPPCASTAAVPRVQTKQRFNAHSVASTSPCLRKGRRGYIYREGVGEGPQFDPQSHCGWLAPPASPSAFAGMRTPPAPQGPGSALVVVLVMAVMAHANRHRRARDDDGTHLRRPLARRDVVLHLGPEVLQRGLVGGARGVAGARDGNGVVVDALQQVHDLDLLRHGDDVVPVQLADHGGGHLAVLLRHGPGVGHVAAKGAGLRTKLNVLFVAVRYGNIDLWWAGLNGEQLFGYCHHSRQRTRIHTREADKQSSKVGV